MQGTVTQSVPISGTLPCVFNICPTLPLLSMYRFVGKFICRKDRLRDIGQDQRFTNVYVKNFGEEVTNDQLYQMFAKFGKIVSAKVMVDIQSGR